ncbi:hypothetical protein BB559_000625 [Furculomyces boomerangus]|uniref:AAA+ ATPase domain-containing protein n=3 Tax=Harpellales TaxID=61421 RepID=A0A2T9Z4N8_9FUNG|nr:hypothetical protein BB559_000625 [Furculomyces boomerangus]
MSLKRNVGGKLWTEKYKPTHFLNLVGNDRINRVVLQWVKHWDYCVFGKENAAASIKKSLKEQKRPQTSRFGNNVFKTKNNENSKTQYEDRLKRPFKKILLLSGPPGVGKTTLANIVAKQSGYKAMEINASDDRTASKIKGQILAVTGNQSITEDQSPRLLVIDEIDGVSTSRSNDESFISVLVKLVNEDNSISLKKINEGGQDHEDNHNSQKLGKTKKKGPKTIRRPIICICNDLYTPSLYALREVAMVIQVHPPTTEQIARHLKYVCNEENLKVDDWGLTTLAKNSGGDIRLCLNLLQFSGHGDKNLSTEKLNSISLGSKDMQMPIFSVWDSIFTQPNSKNFRKFINSKFNRSTAGKYMAILESFLVNYAEYSQYLYNTLKNVDDYDKIMQGCFENYLKMNTRDLSHSKLSEISEIWLYFYDTINNFISKSPSNGYVLFGYLIYPLMAFHRVCMNPLGLDGGDFTFPSTDNMVNSKSKAFSTNAEQFLSQTQDQSFKARWNKNIFSTYLLDYILRILSPNLTVTNIELFNHDMKKKLSHIVTVMYGLNLSFVQNKTEEGIYIFELQPPLDKMTSYSIQNPIQKPVLKYQVKMLISHELDIVKMKQTSHAILDNNPSERPDITNKQQHIFLSDTRFSNALKNKNDVEPKEVHKRTSNVKEFFSTKKNDVAKDEGSSNLAANPDSKGFTDTKTSNDVSEKEANVWFQYNEGYSNAVRHPVIIRDLL